MIPGLTTIYFLAMFPCFGQGDMILNLFIEQRHTGVGCSQVDTDHWTIDFLFILLRKSETHEGCCEKSFPHGDGRVVDLAERHFSGGLYSKLEPNGNMINSFSYTLASPGTFHTHELGWTQWMCRCSLKSAQMFRTHPHLCSHQMTRYVHIQSNFLRKLKFRTGQVLMNKIVHHLGLEHQLEPQKAKEYPPWS